MKVFTKYDFVSDNKKCGCAIKVEGKQYAIPESHFSDWGLEIISRCHEKKTLTETHSQEIYKYSGKKKVVWDEHDHVFTVYVQKLFSWDEIDKTLPEQLTFALKYKGKIYVKPDEMDIPYLINNILDGKLVPLKEEDMVKFKYIGFKYYIKY